MSQRIIQFIHSGRAVLPELVAYREFLEKHLGVDVRIEPSQEPLPAAAIHWFIMGMDPIHRPHRVPRIHEYASLSTGRLPRLKNYMKKLLSARPRHRVFLNEFVMAGMGFDDGVPSHLRDMGIWDGFLSTRACPGSGRWLYAGAISKSRGMDKFLAWWTQQPDTPELILCGPANPELINEYASHPSIRFVGKVPRERVAEIASTCEYGLNVLYDVYPLSRQTCTKVLEYCAMDLKVVTTRSAWIEAFARNHEGIFAYIDLENMPAMEDIVSSGFHNPDVSRYRWETIFERSCTLQMVEDCLSLH